MRRRELIAAFVLPCIASRAAAQAKARIAILHSGFPHRTPIDQLYALRDLGHEHGRSADIELLGAEGDADRLTSLVAKLVRDRPQIVVAVTSPAALALKRANVTTPVVFLFVSDPIRLGLVESLPRPGANYTGVTFSDAFLGAKRLELLADAVPGIRIVAVLWSPQFEENAALLDSIRNAAKRLGIAVAAIEIGGAARLPAAFDEAVAARAQAVIFITENALFDHRRTIADLALARRLQPSSPTRLKCATAGSCPSARTSERATSVPRRWSIACSREPRRGTSRWRNPPGSPWRSTWRPRRPSDSPCRDRSSPAPTRWSNEALRPAFEAALNGPCWAAHGVPRTSPSGMPPSRAGSCFPKRSSSGSALPSL